MPYNVFHKILSGLQQQSTNIRHNAYKCATILASTLPACLSACLSVWKKLIKQDETHYQNIILFSYEHIFFFLRATGAPAPAAQLKFIIFSACIPQIFPYCSSTNLVHKLLFCERQARQRLSRAQLFLSNSLLRSNFNNRCFNSR